jgi:heterodisulfide reductase subunit A-like polyferredoxin
MTAALSLADQGFDTCLVEREPELGGLARKLHYTLGGSDVQKELKELIEQVEANPGIQIFKGAEVREFSGHVGNFTATISANGSTQEINHGAVVIATGGSEYEPTEYLYGKNSGVLTQIELEERIAGGEIKGGPLKSVVMIQCVGSREEGNMYCCRVGCTEAIKNALKLKAIDPDVEVAVLYRDIRTYAFSEIHYREAREKGVLFLRYDEDKKPEVYEEGGGLKIKIFDETFGKDIVLEPDCLVLTSSIRPHPLSEELSTRLKASLNPEGFYLEAHMKLRPLDFANDGMYLCGLAHNPKLMGECISQAKGAAARAATILSKKELTISGIISVVDQDHCAACLTCVRECPFDVPVITEDGVAYIEPASCQGCGMCASVCPRKAIEVQHYKDDQIVAKCLTVMDESA